MKASRTAWESRPKRVIAPYTKWKFLAKYLSTAGHEKPSGNPGGPPSKAKYTDDR
jgi:hypothetical protein